MQRAQFSKFIIPSLALICLLPFLSSSASLFLGIAVALAFGNPYLEKTKKITRQLLTLSVVGLGAGMNLNVVAQVGRQGLGYTIFTIAMTLGAGLLLGRLLSTEKKTSLLISVGTAICGGSAIAAIAPIIKAKSHEISVALGTVFILNAVALFIFPFIGHKFSLTENQFGLWCALSIHDTSSVVGATLQYGSRALEIGTTTKLARALWIVPLAILVSLFVNRNESKEKTNLKLPWFILGFILVSALVTWIPQLKIPGHYIETVAKRGLVLTLFFIGTNLTWEALRSVGLRPFFQGFILWLLVASLTLGAVVY